MVDFPRCSGNLEDQCIFGNKAVFFQRGKFIQTSFIFPETGDYYIWLRPRHVPNWANSFYVALNQEGPQYANIIAPRMIDNSGFTNSWQWSDGNIFMVNFKANQLYTLTIYFREEGIENGPYLDLICFTPTKTFPPNTRPASSSILPNVEISPTATPTSPPCPNRNLGNFDCDPQGLINEVDLTLMLQNWGQADYDLTNDGKVDEADLSVLMSNWKNN